MAWFIDNESKPLPPSQDIEYAFALLRGIGVVRPGIKTPREMVKKVEFPSATTKPTEKDARAALARVLSEDGPPEFLEVGKELLRELAGLFDPAGPYPPARRRIEFKNLNQGHGDRDREMGIATQMMLRLDEGASYERAAQEVAELCGIGERQVKKIYQKKRDKFARVAVGEDLLKILKLLIPDLKALGLPEDQFRALEDLPPDRRKLTSEGVKMLLKRLVPKLADMSPEQRTDDMSSDRRTQTITHPK